MARLDEILHRETSAHTSSASFVADYLRLIDFPADVVEVLENGDINRFEVEQLARVIAGRLGMTAGQANRSRIKLLSSLLRVSSVEAESGQGEALRNARLVK